MWLESTEFTCCSKIEQISGNIAFIYFTDIVIAVLSVDLHHPPGFMSAGSLYWKFFQNLPNFDISGISTMMAARQGGTNVFPEEFA